MNRMQDFNGKDIVVLTQEEYDELVKRSEWLGWLEQAGVDNWDGYSYAFELRDEDQQNAR